MKKKSSKNPLSAQNLNSLLYLQALLQEKHVSRAAKKVGLSQPGMSHALRELRGLLNDPILIQSNKNYIPTEKAIKVQSALDEAMSLIEYALVEDHFDPHRDTAHFKIMVTDYSGFLFLPQLMDRISPYSGITIEVIPWQNIDNGRDHNFDCAIGFSVGKKYAGYDCITLYNEYYVCMCRNDHPRIHDSLTLHDFLQESQLIVRENAGAIGVVDHALEKLGLKAQRKIRLEVDHFLLFPFIISQTDMIITTTSRNALLFVDKLPIKIVSVPLDIPTIPVTLIYPSRHHLNPANQWFRSIIESISRTV